MIFDIILIGILVFFCLSLTWLGVIICIARHIVKDKSAKKAPPKFDEFDWWQDNQGL